MKLQVQNLDVQNSQDTQNSYEVPSWKRAFSSAIKTLDELLQYVDIQPEQVSHLQENLLSDFPIRVPRSFADKIKKGDVIDPLLLQVLPSTEEGVSLPGYVQDPLDEAGSNPVPGIIHKYGNRVLFVATQACIIHCRYCFRRYFPYSENALSSKQFEQALAYIAEHQELDEVILSGGDPLSLSDQKLTTFLNAIAELKHIKRIRIHSRLLAVLPERVTDDFLNLMAAFNKKMVIVVHINHKNEIDEFLTKTFLKLRSTGAYLFNQTVLLKNINDDHVTLADLNLALFDIGVLPYYLHLMDPVSGTHHFDVSRDKAVEIMQKLQTCLPGYLVPKLVKEEAHKPSKTVIHY